MTIVDKLIGVVVFSINLTSEFACKPILRASDFPDDIGSSTIPIILFSLITGKV